MLSLSDTSVTETARILGSYEIIHAFLVPTPIGLEKSILDATKPLRKVLRDLGVHDYDTQEKGPKNKRSLQAEIITDDGANKVQVSLYRPIAKDGDPRIWPYKLKQSAKPGNLLAFIPSVQPDLLILNCSEPGIQQALHDPGSSLVTRIRKISGNQARSNDRLQRVLGKLREIALQGPLPSVRRGDTGVGATLEDALGIRTNSHPGPDIEGIEIKSRRTNRKANKHVLFSQVPRWERSRLKEIDLLNEHGIPTGKDGALKLYNTVSTLRPNSFGHVLRIANEGRDLELAYTPPGAHPVTPPEATWSLGLLHQRLLEKHTETLWVEAETTQGPSGEEFHYVAATYTHSPNTEVFDALLADRKITLDLTLSLKPNGKCRNHGYLFKLKSGYHAALFSGQIRFDLMSN